MVENERKLYVGNLPPDIVEEEIHEVFGLYGSIAEVYINTPRDNRSVRSAFVRFAEVQDAAAAMAVLSEMYKFREESSTPIRVNIARPSSSGAGKGFSGKGAGSVGSDAGEVQSRDSRDHRDHRDHHDAYGSGHGGSSRGDHYGGPPGGSDHYASDQRSSGYGCGSGGGHGGGSYGGSAYDSSGAYGSGYGSGGAYGSGAAVGGPPPPPVGSGGSGGAPVGGGGGHWSGDGYGRPPSNGRQDNGGRWPVGGYPGETGTYDGANRDPISGRDIMAKLWVGNLPGDASREMLEKVFGTYGQVEEVNILPAKSRSGQLCAFVHYATPQQADVCLTAMQAGYELRPGEGELKVERPASTRKGYDKGDGRGKGGPPRRYQPY